MLNGMKQDRFLGAFLLTTATLLGCDSGDGNEANADASSETDAGSHHDGGSGSGGKSCSACAPSEACVEFNIKVLSDSADLPWKLFPGESTGVGRMFAGVFAAGSPSKQKYEDEVDLKSASAARKLEVCVSPGSANAFCFLDDKGDGVLRDADGLLTGSSNYRDTCMSQRQKPISTSVGSTTSVDCTLSISCD